MSLDVRKRTSPQKSRNELFTFPETRETLIKSSTNLPGKLMGRRKNIVLPGIGIDQPLPDQTSPMKAQMNAMGNWAKGYQKKKAVAFESSQNLTSLANSPMKKKPNSPMGKFQRWHSPAGQPPNLKMSKRLEGGNSQTSLTRIMDPSSINPFSSPSKGSPMKQRPKFDGLNIGQVGPGEVPQYQKSNFNGEMSKKQQLGGLKKGKGVVNQTIGGRSYQGLSTQGLPTQTNLKLPSIGELGWKEKIRIKTLNQIPLDSTEKKPKTPASDTDNPLKGVFQIPFNSIDPGRGRLFPPKVGQLDAWRKKAKDSSDSKSETSPLPSINDPANSSSQSALSINTSNLTITTEKKTHRKSA
jgi:hypothetical protein